MYRNVIFDLDGVICSTDEQHYLVKDLGGMKIGMLNYTYGEIGDFRSFLQNYCKSPIKKYAIDYPHVQHIVDEINSITFTATTEKE